MDIERESFALRILSELPSELAQAAVPILALLPGHRAQSQGASALVATMKESGEEAAIELLLSLASGGADRLKSQAETLDAHQRILRERRMNNRELLGQPSAEKGVAP